MTYAERYLNGEYEQVWSELMELGSSVCKEELSLDVHAVARETMRRVRKNIEILIKRLISIGFIFGYDHKLLAKLDKYPIVHSEYIEMVAWVHRQPPVFHPSRMIEEISTDQDNLKDFPWYEDLIQPSTMEQVIHDINQQIGPVPFSVLAWYEEVGAVNFYGYHPKWNQLVRSFLPRGLEKIPLLYPVYFMSLCDPVQVCSLDDKLFVNLKSQYNRTGCCIFDFADDHNFKDYYGGSSSSYSFWFPNANADVLLPTEPNSTTFVHYLRTSLLQWGGFPGMAAWPSVPQEDLNILTHDLTPF